ncbi:hypothetical protein GE09DRAFT_10241 [Coniochaeta sp. 2T2.1]|nr:hypothetical protein GE09DRAFT_10241 [Coniochaeta sp. 2T2.1]
MQICNDADDEIMFLTYARPSSDSSQIRSVQMARTKPRTPSRSCAKLVIISCPSCQPLQKAPKTVQVVTEYALPQISISPGVVQARPQNIRGPPTSLIPRDGSHLEQHRIPLRLGPLGDSLKITDGRLVMIDIVSLQRLGDVSDRQKDVIAAQLANRASIAVKDWVGRGIPAALLAPSVSVGFAGDGVARVELGVEGALFDVVEHNVNALQILEAVQEVGYEPQLAADLVVMLVLMNSAGAAELVRVRGPEDAGVDLVQLDCHVAYSAEYGEVEDQHPVSRRGDVLRGVLARLPMKLEVEQVGRGVNCDVEVVVCWDGKGLDEAALHRRASEREGGAELGPFMVPRPDALREVTAVGHVLLVDLVAWLGQLNLPHSVLVAVRRGGLEGDVNGKKM